MESHISLDGYAAGALTSMWGQGIGAEIMGRRKFGPQTGDLPDDGWRSSWGCPSDGSGLRAPARTARACPIISSRAAGRDRGGSHQPAGPPNVRQVGSDRRDRSLAGRVVAPGVGDRQDANGSVEAIRALLVAQRSGRQARARCLPRSVTSASPAQICCANNSVTSPKRISRVKPAALRPRAGTDAVLHTTKLAMRTLSRRALVIDDDHARPRNVLAGLVTQTAPALLACHGVGVDTAAMLLVTAGDNPGTDLQ